jgi:Ion channel
MSKSFFSSFPSKQQNSSKARIVINLLHWATPGSLDAQLRELNLQMTALALAGIGLMIVYNQVCWDSDELRFLDAPGDCVTGAILQFVNMFVTVLLVWRLIVYYQIESLQRQVVWRFESKMQAFKSTTLRYRFCVELLVCIVQPVPFLQDVWGFGSRTVLPVMMLRLYLLARTIHQYSAVFRFRREFFSASDFSESEYTMDIVTVLKTYFLSHTTAVVSLLFLSIVMVSSYGMYIVERGYWINNDTNAIVRSRPPGFHPSDYRPSPFSQFDLCIWFTVITLSTLGYGDIVPIEWEGRLIASLTVLVGVVITSIMVGTVAAKVAPSGFQVAVLRWLNLRKCQRSIELTAAGLIQSAWRMHRLLRDGYTETSVAVRAYRLEMIRRVKRLNKLRRLKRELETAQITEYGIVSAGDAGGEDFDDTMDDTQPPPMTVHRTSVSATATATAASSSSSSSTGTASLAAQMSHLQSQNEQLQKQVDELRSMLQSVLDHVK